MPYVNKPHILISLEKVWCNLAFDKQVTAQSFLQNGNATSTHRDCLYIAVH
jgi:hypothetical protein